MRTLLVLSLAALLAAAAWADEGGSNLEIVTLSNRADLISGGDALVEVRVPKQVSLSAVKVKLNGHDITSSFTASAAARTLRGLVTGLVVGRNDLVAVIAGTVVYVALGFWFHPLVIGVPVFTR